MVCSVIWIVTGVISILGPLRASGLFQESTENPVAASLLTDEEVAKKNEFAAKAKRIF